MRPRIAITTANAPRVSATLGFARPNAAVDLAYVESVARAGGLPFLLPCTDPALVPELLASVDAVVLSGGVDVDPANYGAMRHPRTEPADPARDAFELEVARAAPAAGLPVLAICRGIQVLNVAHGGTLIQHVPDVSEHDHTDVARWNVAANPVAVEPGTCLHELLGQTKLTVNSLHHQAVGDVAAGFRVSARDGDDIVEAIEAGDGRPVLGVQWHPELLWGEAIHQSLFVWLVNRACDRSSVSAER